VAASAFWLYDLANEISMAEKDGTLPSVLALDRVWISRPMAGQSYWISRRRVL